jgi:hypothetical protein
MGRLVIEYLPGISEKAEEIISENITPSMSSYEGDSHQYCLDHILSDISGLLPAADRVLLETLIDDGVSYIEF